MPKSNHRGNEKTGGQFSIKMFYSIYHFLLLVSLVMGAIESDNKDEAVFLSESSVVAIVSLVKVLYIVWRKDDVLELLTRICDFCAEDENTFSLINRKIKYLMNFVTVFVSSNYICGLSCTFVAPFLGSEKTLFVKFGFPLDWRNNEFAYWLAIAFTFKLTCDVNFVVFYCNLLVFNDKLWFMVCCTRTTIQGYWGS